MESLLKMRWETSVVKARSGSVDGLLDVSDRLLRPLRFLRCDALVGDVERDDGRDDGREEGRENEGVPGSDTYILMRHRDFGGV